MSLKDKRQEKEEQLTKLNQSINDLRVRLDQAVILQQKFIGALAMLAELEKEEDDAAE